MKICRSRFLFGSLVGAFAVVAGPPQEVIHHQGRMAVDGVRFDGIGDFKIALVDGGTLATKPPASPVVVEKTLWSNRGSSTTGQEPTTAVLLTVIRGIYSVLLGDTILAGMTKLVDAAKRSLR